MANQKPAILVLICMLIMSFAHVGHAQISCSTVNGNLFPCLSFVMGGGKVDPACCSGLKTLVALAKTRTDRQSACSCLKSLVSSATDPQIKKAAQIPGFCGVQIPIKIARDVDCSKVQK